MPRERIAHVLGAIERLVERTQTTRSDPERVAGEITPLEDEKTKLRRAAGVEDHFASLGVSAGLVQRMRKQLAGAGLDDETALGVAIRVVYEIQTDLALPGWVLFFFVAEQVGGVAGTKRPPSC